MLWWWENQSGGAKLGCGTKKVVELKFQLKSKKKIEEIPEFPLKLVSSVNFKSTLDWYRPETRIGICASLSKCFQKSPELYVHSENLPDYNRVVRRKQSPHEQSCCQSFWTNNQST